MDSHLENIRNLLIQGFNPEELRRICYDTPEFRPVYDQLAEGTGKGRIVDKLLEYAERHGYLEKLLEVAEIQNPAAYKHYKPYETGSFSGFSPDRQAYLDHLRDVLDKRHPHHNIKPAGDYVVLSGRQNRNQLVSFREKGLKAPELFWPLEATRQVYNFRQL